MDNDRPNFFGKEHAAHYDKSSERLAALKNALHSILNIVFRDLPSQSEILCVGAGTGAEIIALAECYPEWRFMALDPSEAMLDVCRQKVEKAGLSARCDFHIGYIDSLPADKFYDAATSILVSQFLTDVQQRREFFKQVRNRMKSGGYLFNADLARPATAQSYEGLKDAWIKMQMFTGLSRQKAQESTALWRTHLAVSEPAEIESIIVSGGFQSPLLCYQALFIHAWCAKVPNNVLSSC
ncbi:class I SAM-dependent methyltransferase [Neptunicella sp. SCSIO 80796]|uniref:class I SAM-dependent methyltransferase n=1 Tax=Neptunicella plasticusilytica TaxID=3117012 RepID=UPI003A4D3D89